MLWMSPVAPGVVCGRLTPPVGRQHPARAMGVVCSGRLVGWLGGAIFVCATSEGRQKAPPWGWLGPNSKRPLELFRWAACLNLNFFPDLQRHLGHVTLVQVRQPVARPVTHTSYRKSCLGCFEFDLGRSSTPGSCQFSALVATKSCVALFWPRSAVSSETQRRKANRHWRCWLMRYGHVRV